MNWEEEARYMMPDASDKKFIGVIAEELEELYPELVSDLIGHKRIHVWQFTVLLLKSIQELSSKVKILEEGVT